MRQASTALLTALFITLLTASGASASGWSFASPPPKMQSGEVTGGAIATWGSALKCGKSGYQISARRLYGDSWSKPYRLSKSCAQNLTNFSQPLLSAESDKAAAVWAETSSRSVGGIYLSHGRAGQSNLKKIRLVKFKSKAIMAPSFGMLLRKGRVWLAWQEPVRNLSAKSGTFKVRAFSARSGKPLTKQLKIVGSGSKWANRNSPGSFIFQPTSAGLLLMWQLTDAGGATEWYGATGGFKIDEATLLTSLSMQARGPISVTRNMYFNRGDDGQLYRVQEVNPGAAECIKKVPVTFILTRWDGATAKWLPTNGENITTPCLDSKPLYVDFAVSSAGQLQLVSKLPPKNLGDCLVRDSGGNYDCQRFTAPEKAGALGKIFNRGADGKVRSTSLNAPESWTPQTGKTVAWMAPTQGLTRLMTGNRLLWLGGVQKISNEGAVTQSGYEAILSSTAN